VQFFENFKSSPKIDYFFYYVGKYYVSTLPKSELGYIVGDFFISKSGRPGDQIGLVFAHLVTVNYGNFLKMTKAACKFGLTFLHG
jgi:hypothetical protein